MDDLEKRAKEVAQELRTMVALTIHEAAMRKSWADRLDPPAPPAPQLMARRAGAYIAICWGDNYDARYLQPKQYDGWDFLTSEWQPVRIVPEALPPMQTPHWHMDNVCKDCWNAALEAAVNVAKEYLRPILALKR